MDKIIRKAKITQEEFESGRITKTAAIDHIKAQINVLQKTIYALADISNTIFCTRENPPDEPQKQATEAVNCAETKLLGYIKRGLDYDLPIKMREVDSICQIPTSYVYFVRDISAYAININGNLVLGHLAEFSEQENIRPCKLGKECKKREMGECGFYHPADVSGIRLSYDSWVYARNKKKCRKIGGRDTIIYDIAAIRFNKEEFNNEYARRNAQLIHDILIYACMCEMGRI